MREIKFRAWIASEMYYSDNAERFNLEWLDMPWGRDFQVGVPGTTANNADDYLMQYTGLKDKNGVEIWEKDIMQFPYIDPLGGVHESKDVSERYIVGFNDGCFGCYDKERNKFYTLDNAHTGIEVIGNIHDNPELLTKATKPEEG